MAKQQSIKYPELEKAIYNWLAQELCPIAYGYYKESLCISSPVDLTLTHLITQLSHRYKN